jgi:predicted DsbA family dithiol-disulfide isomerase
VDPGDPVFTWAYVKRLSFEYWSDPLCIWAFVAQPKLERILAELGDKLEVEHHVVPVFGSIPWRLKEGSWASAGIEGRVQATRSIAAQHGRSDVSGECWVRDCPVSSWSAGVAVEAVLLLEREGRAPRGAGAAYHHLLRERFFVCAENVARRDVQLSIAEELALPRSALEAHLDDGSAIAALWEDIRRKEQLCIQGSPTFVFDGGRAMLYGNFSYGVLRATVDELVRGLDVGASRC